MAYRPAHAGKMPLNRFRPQANRQITPRKPMTRGKMAYFFPVWRRRVERGCAAIPVESAPTAPGPVRWVGILTESGGTKRPGCAKLGTKFGTLRTVLGGLFGPGFCAKAGGASSETAATANTSRHHKLRGMVTGYPPSGRIDHPLVPGSGDFVQAPWSERRLNYPTSCSRWCARDALRSRTRSWRSRRRRTAPAGRSRAP